jgi:hypothetical protein
MWSFRRKGKGNDELGPLLPGEKGIGESQKDAGDYLAKAISPEGRIKGILHPETSRRDDRLGPEAPAPQPMPREGGLGSDAATRGRMVVLLCDAAGKPAPADLRSAGGDEAAFRRTLDVMFSELAGRMSYSEFSAKVAAGLRARAEAEGGDELARRSFNVAANWLRLTAKDKGLA